MAGSNLPIAFNDSGEGVPIVFIHGGFSDGHLTWGAQMSLLVNRHRLLVVDRRGHGKSPKEPRPYTIVGDAEDVHLTLDQVGIENFHLVGHSYGSLVAMELALRVPERILSLHMIEPPYLALLPRDPDVQALSTIGANLFANAEQLSAEEITIRFFTDLLGPATLAYLRTRPAWSALVREAEAEPYAEFPDTYAAKRASELRLGVPVRVYCGGASSVGMRKLASATAESITGARLVVIPEASHDLQRKPEFNAALLAVTAATCADSKGTMQ